MTPSDVPPGGDTTEVGDRWARVGRWVPGVAVARTYRPGWLRADLVAGLVLTSLLVPQGMAYAELAGLPPVTGLYATVACLVGYAVMGPSRILVLGPDSALSPMVFAAIASVGATKDPTRALELAGMLALIVGALEVLLGLARFGFVADLLSKEVKVGYLNGLAVVIIAGQLPKLCGFSLKSEGTLERIGEFFGNLDHTNTTALLTGLLCLAALLILPRVSRAVPAVLVVIVVATAMSELLDLSAKGVSTVGPLPQGLPSPTVPWTSVSDLGPLTVAALGITLVSLADTIATSASFADRRGETVSADKEMIGIGVANAAAGFFQGFAVSSSASRTAVADAAKAKSQVAGLVGAAGVIVMLLFLNELLSALPQTALAAVVIAAALSLADLTSLTRYWQVRRTAVLVSTVATAGVIVLGVLDGILCAIGLSVILFFRRNWWPHGEVLGRRPDGGWHAVSSDPTAKQCPGVVVFRWEAPLFFANTSIFRHRVSALVAPEQIRWLVLQCEAVNDIDVTASDMLADLDNRLNAKGIHIAFVELRSRLVDQLGRYGLFESALAREHVYGSIDQALAEITHAGSTELPAPELPAPELPASELPAPGGGGPLSSG